MDNPVRPHASHGTAEPAKPHIREATAMDTDAIVAILIASKEGSFPHLIDDHDRDVPFWTNRWRRYLSEGSRAQQSRGDGFAFLAESDGRPVGFAAYHHTTRHGADAELQAIYVLREAQGRGLGTALLWVIGGRLYAEGSRTMCVGYDSRSPYKRFYLKHGAVEINRHWARWQDLGMFAQVKAEER
ncbi:MAG: GNAT family N-acetyltransferase [Gemmatimonadetes bacterium]|nr:GNAT family N-acetyltransferase [Gemmatimonadota bacterium]